MLLEHCYASPTFSSLVVDINMFKYQVYGEFRLERLTQELLRLKTRVLIHLKCVKVHFFVHKILERSSA